MTHSAHYRSISNVAAEAFRLSGVEYPRNGVVTGPINLYTRIRWNCYFERSNGQSSGLLGSFSEG
jgi:hypothetical protein